MSFPTDYRMIVLQGMSGSGKSTFAKNLVEECGEKYKIVSRDEIRQRFLTPEELESYFDHHLNIGFEDFITVIEHYEIASILGSGRTVIIDNTNLRKKYVMEYLKIARDFGVSSDEIRMVQLPCGIGEASERIQQRGERFVDESVLRSQFDSFNSVNWTIPACYAELEDNYVPKQWFVPKFPVDKYVPDESKPKAIICDIDGTLAHRTVIKTPYPHMRSFFDYAACGTDEKDALVSLLVKGAYAQGCKIIFLSGRKNDCEKETLEFIHEAFGEKDFALFMRDPQIDRHNGKDDPDDIVKYRIFNEEIRNNYNVIGAIDDRKRILALWEALGLKTINVGKLNEVF